MTKLCSGTEHGGYHGRDANSQEDRNKNLSRRQVYYKGSWTVLVCGSCGLKVISMLKILNHSHFAIKSTNVYGFPTGSVFFFFFPSVFKMLGEERMRKLTVF